MFKHEHRWHFLQARTEIEPVDLGTGHDNIFEKIEYAYYVCNDCPDTDGEPNTIKRKITHVRTEEA